ncbi:UNVERIFIED_CONTAM: hypothetical protein Slati_1881100 [Sesamum latifolium]|uniref:Uncharacterized protein n=1 Tax=Sesamum latifolium TaxID=2727402 RepID=A0AAW2X0E4_9LAMI
MKATNDRDSTCSGRMVPLTPDDLPLMLTASVQGPTSAAPSLLSLLNSNVPTNSIFHVQDVPLKKQKVVETPSNAQALQIAKGTSLSLASRGPPSSGAVVPGPPIPADPLTESPHYSTSSGGLPPGLLYTIQHMVTTVVHEQITTLFPAHTVTPSNVDVPNKEDKRVPPAPVPLVAGG